MFIKESSGAPKESYEARLPPNWFAITVVQSGSPGDSWRDHQQEAFKPVRSDSAKSRENHMARISHDQKAQSERKKGVNGGRDVKTYLAEDQVSVQEALAG